VITRIVNYRLKPREGESVPARSARVATADGNAVDKRFGKPLPPVYFMSWLREVRKLKRGIQQ
jgi:hypothetical protein